MKHRDSLLREGRRLEYFTIFYNSLEGLIAVSTGLLAGSIALVGFGFDSVIEVTSGATLLWVLQRQRNESQREEDEGIALRIVGSCFLLLAGYVGYEAIVALTYESQAACGQRVEQYCHGCRR